jgi:amidase
MPFGDPDAISMPDLRIAFYTDNGDVAASPEVSSVVRDCVRVVAARGATVTEACPSVMAQSRRLFGRIFSTDGGAWIRRLLDKLGTQEIYPFLHWTDQHDDAPEATAAAVTALMAEWEQFRRRMLAFLQHYDVMLAPVHAYPALAHGELTSDEKSPAFSYAQPYNLTG